MGLDALIVIGGNGSLTVACKLHTELGLPIVGVPKTIDNDVVGTDVTFGFNTAVQIATDAIDRLHTTAESHDRVMVVEVMGRHSGWIATHAGIAGGATVILIPERPFDIDPCARSCGRHDRGRYASIVVVAEGAEPSPHDGRPRQGLRPVRSRPARRHGRPLPPDIESAPVSRPAWCCSATSSVVAHPRHSIGCCPPATASPRSTPCTCRRGARWWRCATMTATHPAQRDRRQDPAGRHAPLPRRRRGLLRLSRSPLSRVLLRATAGWRRLAHQHFPMRRLSRKSCRTHDRPPIAVLNDRPPSVVSDGRPSQVPRARDVQAWARVRRGRPAALSTKPGKSYTVSGWSAARRCPPATLVLAVDEHLHGWTPSSSVAVKTIWASASIRARSTVQELLETSTTNVRPTATRPSSAGGPPGSTSSARARPATLSGPKSEVSAVWRCRRRTASPREVPSLARVLGATR